MNCSPKVPRSSRVPNGLHRTTCGSRGACRTLGIEGARSLLHQPHCAEIIPSSIRYVYGVNAGAETCDFDA